MRPTISVLALLLASCSGGSPIEPGMWQSKVQLKAGDSLLWTSEIGRCISEPETGEPVAGMLSVTPLGLCRAIESDYAAGRVLVRVACMGKTASMMPGMASSQTAVDGRRDPQSINAEILVTLDDAPQRPLKGTLTARRTGDCTA